VSVATDILYPALRLAGVITAAGRGPSVSQKADAFAALNRMVDSWFQQRLMIYTILLSRYTMVPSQTSYTIGPGGDFEAKWPVEIKSAAIILRGPTEVYMPLKLLTHAEWAAKSDALAVKAGRVRGPVPYRGGDRRATRGQRRTPRPAGLCQRCDPGRA